jgi:predicted DsbA family dithiol-disulfide isomerase
VVESLFKAYFEENKSLGELTVLEDCASRAGYSDSLEFLRSELGEHEVKEEIQLFGRDFQCTGVPMFIIDDGKFILNGAQESDQFLRVFAKLS